MKQFIAGLFAAAFSYAALAQTPQDRAAADRAQCEKVVVKSPVDAIAARDKCLQELALQRHREVMEKCKKEAAPLARPTIPQEAFYKDCMYTNGYKYE